MAFPFDSSYSNHSHLGPQNNPINGQFNQFNSNNLHLNDQTMNQNHALFNSHQTERISPLRNSITVATNNHLTVPAVGQLAMNQRLVNEVRNTTTLIPQRVQVVQTVNINYFPVQNQTSLAGSAFGDHHEFCVTEIVKTREVVRTQLLNSASTREHFLAPNHDHYGSWNTRQGQSNLQNQVPIHNFGHNAYRLSQCFNDSQSSTSNPFENPRFEQYSSYQYVPNSGFNQNPPSRNQSATLRLIENDDSAVVNVEPFDVVFPVGTKNPIPTQNQAPPNNDDEVQNLQVNIDHHDDHQVHNTIFKEDKHHEEDGDKIEGDGRTHSLPYKKYGPYTCPKCKGVFMTSQLFAAHMGSHYKYESVEQRRKRHLAKYSKKKHLRLINSRDGLTVFPRLKNKTVNNGHKRNVSEDQVDENKEREHQMATMGFQFEGLVDVPVKEEPLDIYN